MLCGHALSSGGQSRWSTALLEETHERSGREVEGAVAQIAALEDLAVGDEL